MKLYDLPKGARIKEQCSDGSKYIIFDHIDGMYSYCETEKGNTIHLSATTPLKQEKGYYIIEEDQDPN